MDKLVIALNLVIDFIDQQPDAVDEKKISDYLYYTGFDDYEIRQTLSLLDTSGVEANAPIRFFTRQETRNIEEKARTYLQKLLLSGVIDILVLEDIIEMALETEGYSADVEQVKQYTLITLLERKSLQYTSSGIFEDTTH